MAQYAIIKQKTKAQSCEGYISNVSSGDTSLYFFFGNPVAWSNVPGGSYNDTNPPIPSDTLFAEKQIWDGIIGMKKVTSNDVKTAVKRINWQSGQYYDMYRDDYNGTTVTGVSLAGEYVNTKPQSLARSNNLILVDDAGVFKLYRCIDNRSSTNGDPIASTTKPTFTTANIVTLADGYKWKYMGELSSTDISEFMTTNHCPFPSTIASASVSGQATAVVLTSRGEGYASAPSVTVKGDGTGMVLGTPVVLAGRIVYVPIVSAGTGYTYANLTFSGGSATTEATARIILSPIGGFASNLTKEIEANYAVVRVNNLESDAYFTTRGNAPVSFAVGEIENLKYRVVGLLENPYDYGTTTVSTNSLLTNFTEHKYNVIAGTAMYGDRLTTSTSGLDNPVATVVSVRDNSSSIVNQISFNAATVVDDTMHEISYTNHKYITGDSVLYNNNGGTSISGLTTGETYYIILVDVDTIKLAASHQDALDGIAIPITAGVGSGQSLTQTVLQKYVGLIRTTEQLIEQAPTSGDELTTMDEETILALGPYITFNGSSSSVVSVGENTISIPSHPFKTGDSVKYSNGGGTSINTTAGLLINATTYYVIRVSSDEIKLASTLANANLNVALDLINVGSGSSHSLTYNDTDSVKNPTVEKYSGNITFVEYRNSVTRTTSKEKFRIVLEF